MRRKDLRAVVVYEKNVALANRSVTDDELVEAITSDPDLMAKVLGGGRWVPWCVAHDAMGWGSPSSGCANPAAGTKPCVWHPQGAFIPEADA